MNEADRTLAMRMIPYGVYVLTAVDPRSMQVAACTLHWLTQTSFSPCMLAAALPNTHPALGLMRATNRFAINILGKDDAEEALTFARPTRLEGSLAEGDAKLGGWGVMWGRHATLLLLNAVAVLECDMRALLEAGDHFPVIAEVIDVHVRLPQAGRPDAMSLRIEELGDTFFYGG